ncbi:hypothetical protein ACFL4T_07160 [candidate division KSB1 bacterium]
MLKYQEELNGHIIEILCSIWSGKEIIKYDGQIISKKRKFRSSSIHNFAVNESGERILYIVELFWKSLGLGYEIKKNGATVAQEGEKNTKLNFLILASAIVIAGICRYILISVFGLKSILAGGSYAFFDLLIEFVLLFGFILLSILIIEKIREKIIKSG